LNGTGHTYGVAVRATRHFSSHLALEVGGVFARYCGYKIVMLEAALQEPAGAAGVTLTVENGAILITPPP
jgi:hypothetical protein